MTMTAGTAVPPVQSEMSLYRLHLMRGGYLLMGVGLAAVKWPLLPGASDSSRVRRSASSPRCPCWRPSAFATRSNSCR